MDFKYDVLKHPNVALSADGQGKPYIHGEVTNAIASVNIDFSNITRLEQTDDEQDYNILDDYDIVSSEEIDKYFKKEGIL